LVIDLGNRGKCAQPCRLPYELIKDDGIKTSSCGKGYLLSPKDLSTLDILKELPNVTCLKIEGRMKSPEYVATVVSLYRKYLDNLNSVPSKEDKQELAQIFNRGGFSHAYLKGKFGKDTMCYEKPKNWGIYIGKIINYDGKKTIEVANENGLEIINGDGIEVWNGNNESPSFIVSFIKQKKNSILLGNIHGNIKAGDKVYRTSSKLLNGKALESFSRGFKRHEKIDVLVKLTINNPVEIMINDFKFISTETIQIAQSAPIQKEKIEEQFRKTGNTPFEIANLSIEMDENIFIPISKLNEIRRNALEEYASYLLNTDSRFPASFPQYSGKENSTLVHHNKETSVYFNIFKKEYLNLLNVDCFYFNFKDIVNNYDYLQNYNERKYAVFPIITKSNYAKFIKDNLSKVAKIVDGFVISNIGQLEYVKDLLEHKELELIANYSLNTFNSEAVELLNSLGFSKIILSPELTNTQINDIIKKSYNVDSQIEVIAYGSICVMTSEYCPIGSVAGGFCKEKKCSKPCLKNEKYYLKDRMNMNFRVISDNIDCQSKIYNSKTNSIETNKLYCDSLLLSTLDESFNEMQEAILIHKSGEKISGDKYTNGHYNRPV